jgi:hypothetical protein
MNQKFERIEKRLYLRQYQTAGGEWSTLYYVRFKDWKGKHRNFPVGSKLKTAREELTVYQAQHSPRRFRPRQKQIGSGARTVNHCPVPAKVSGNEKGLTVIWLLEVVRNAS